MITYLPKQKLFHLTNKSISYYIYLNEEGYLETIYFGKYLPNIENIDWIRKPYTDNNATQYFSVKDQKEYTFKDNFRSNRARLEISSHGKNDKRGAPIVIRKENGSYLTNFLFDSYKIIEGIPTLENLPHAKNDHVSTLEITLKEELQDIYVKYYLSLYDDIDILVKNFVIENKTGHDIKIDRALSLQQDFMHANYRFVHFKGCWSKERDYEINDVHDGIQEVTSNYGRSSHEENPFVYLFEKNATNTTGEVIGFNLIYSGNFKFRMFVDYQKYLHVTYGINDEDFEWTLKNNEQFITPQAVISYSYLGVDKMSQNFHYFVKNHLITYKKDKEYKEVLFNSWEGCYFTFNTESIISYIDDSIKIGSELFVLDDGWFGVRDNDYTGLGDWYVNKDKVDLHKVIKHCHDKKLKFGIWFEPEMVTPYSELYKNHPDYILGEKEENILTIQRHQFHLDFANPEVVDNIYEQMVKFLDEYQVDYIKWDYNRTVSEHFSRYYGANQQGEIYHRLVLGYYSLLSRLINRYPHIMFEGCASGGGRFDLGTLFYCPQIWCSDESDPIQRIFIQYNTSLGYPLSTIGSHVNANRITSYKTKALIALFGTYGYEMNPNKLTKEEMDELSLVADIYKKYHREVIEEGTLYHLFSPTETNYMSMQAVSLDKSKSLIIFMNKLKETDQSRFVKLHGLDENKMYKNSFNNEIYSGLYYMQVGINFSFDWFDEFTCKLIILEEIK